MVRVRKRNEFVVTSDIFKKSESQNQTVRIRNGSFNSSFLTRLYFNHSAGEVDDFDLFEEALQKKEYSLCKSLAKSLLEQQTQEQDILDAILEYGTEELLEWLLEKEEDILTRFDKYYILRNAIAYRNDIVHWWQIYFEQKTLSHEQYNSLCGEIDWNPSSQVPSDHRDYALIQSIKTLAPK